MFKLLIRQPAFFLNEHYLSSPAHCERPLRRGFPLWQPQGKKRFKIREQVTDDPYFIAKVDYLDENFPKSSRKIKALEESLKEAATRILYLNPEIPREAQVALDNIDNTAFLTHFLSSNINAPVESKQRLLEINDGVDRATLLLEFMMKD